MQTQINAPFILRLDPNANTEQEQNTQGAYMRNRIGRRFEDKKFFSIQKVTPGREVGYLLPSR
jgi:hypothetical protein